MTTVNGFLPSMRRTTMRTGTSFSMPSEKPVRSRGERVGAGDVGVAGQHPAGRVVDREVLLLLGVEEDVAELARREVERRACRRGTATLPAMA